MSYKILLLGYTCCIYLHYGLQSSGNTATNSAHHATVSNSADHPSTMGFLSEREYGFIVNSETIEVGMIVACYVADYADEEPQIGKLVALENGSAVIEWMTGTYSEPWIVYKCRSGRNYETWRDTIPISSILFPIELTASNRITSALKLRLQEAYEQRRSVS